VRPHPSEFLKPPIGSCKKSETGRFQPIKQKHIEMPVANAQKDALESKNQHSSAKKQKFCSHTKEKRFKSRQIPQVLQSSAGVIDQDGDSSCSVSRD